MNIRLCRMTKPLIRRFFQDFANDPDVFADLGRFQPYVYNEESADAYWKRQQDLGRIHLAIMLGEEPIGEIILKQIDTEQHQCTLSIHMKNDAFKNHGYGTQAEVLALAYAFDELEMNTVFADALIKNYRSRHDGMGLIVVNKTRTLETQLLSSVL